MCQSSKGSMLYKITEQDIIGSSVARLYRGLVTRELAIELLTEHEVCKDCLAEALEELS